MPSRADDPPLYFETHVFCCVNRREAGHVRGCCAEKGADDLRGYMKDRAKALGLKRVRINQSGCLDRCEMGVTLVVYPEGVWYTVASRADIDEVLETHLLRGERVQRLILTPDQKRLTAAQEADRAARAAAD
jgi:(2Fe-2S) ferredoxin